MSKTNCVHGINYSDGTDVLLACRYGLIKKYNSDTSVWDIESVDTFNFSADIDTENFLNYGFFVNGNNANRTRDSSGNWSTSTNVLGSPISKYITELDIQLYLANIKIGGVSYPSRVWISDLPKNNQITWGLEVGSDLEQTADSAVVTSDESSFQTRNIKTGDPLLIVNGTNAGEYTVRTVDSETQITLTETLDNTVASASFWVGGNYIDVKTDDGDELTGVTSNAGEALFFKKLSLHRYSSRAGTLRQVKATAGTTSPKSIVSLDDYTYYYDSASDAIRRYNAGVSIIISNGIEDLLQNISSSMRNSVVGWASKGTRVEFYIGDTTTSDGDSVTKCVLIWDTITETWAARSIPWAIEQRGKWIQNNQPDTYLGTQDGRVLKVDDGTDYDGAAISFFLQDQPIFPEGSEGIVDFQRVRFYIENGPDIQITYRILYAPSKNGGWYHTDWRALAGRSGAAREEFSIKNQEHSRGSGIQFRFIQSGTNETFTVEKYVVYYSNPAIK